MAKNYPRLQTVIIFIVCVIAVVELAAYVRGKNPPKSAGSAGQNLALESNRAMNGSGSDNAGSINSADWQKQFFSQNSKGAINLNKPKQASKMQEKPLTLTDRISRDLFTQYWQIHQAGLESDTDVINGVSNNFASQVAAAASPVIYSASDIKISQGSASAAIKAYAKNLMTALGKIPVADAAVIANDALNGKQGASLSQIDPLIASYRSIVSSMKTMTVPDSFAGNHLNILNALSTMLFNAEALRKTDVDPVRGLAAVSIYIQGLQKLSDSLADLQNGFNSMGIVFADSSSPNKP